MSGLLGGIGGEDRLQLKLDARKFEIQSKSDQNEIELAELLDDAERLAVGVHGRQIFHNPAPPPGVVEKLAEDKLKADRTKVATVKDGKLMARYGHKGKRPPVKRHTRVLLGDSKQQVPNRTPRYQGPGSVIVS